jgi:hypothetical protein
VFDLNLSPDQRTVVEGARDECESANGVAMENMKREYLTWKERTCSRSGFIFDEYNRYAADMQRLQQARIDKCKSAVVTIETLLKPEQLEVIRGEYESWRGSLDSFDNKRDATIKRHGGWPGPHD